MCSRGQGRAASDPLPLLKRIRVSRDALEDVRLLRRVLERVDTCGDVTSEDGGDESIHDRPQPGPARSETIAEDHRQSEDGGWGHIDLDLALYNGHGCAGAGKGRFRFRANPDLGAADGGDVRSGIIIVAHAHDLAGAERVEPDDLTLEGAAGRLGHAGPEEERGHVVAADEVAAQLHP